MKTNPTTTIDEKETGTARRRTRPFRACCTASVYKDDYDTLFDYAVAQQVTVRQAFADAVQALGEKTKKLAADRGRRAAGK